MWKKIKRKYYIGTLRLQWVFELATLRDKKPLRLWISARGGAWFKIAINDWGQDIQNFFVVELLGLSLRIYKIY